MTMATVTEAAAALGLTKSTVSEQVSRFVRDGALAKDAEGRFDLERYRELRAQAVNPLKARNDGGAAIEQAAGAGAVIVAAHADEKRIDAEIKLIKLAQLRQQLADIGDLAAAGTALAGELQEIKRRRRRASAEKIALLTGGDLIAIELLLEEQDRDELTELAAAMQRKAEGFDERAAA